MGFAALLLDFMFRKETYPPIVLIEKAAELPRRTRYTDNDWGSRSGGQIFRDKHIAKEGL